MNKSSPKGKAKKCDKKSLGGESLKGKIVWMRNGSLDRAEGAFLRRRKGKRRLFG